ncbi:MULTISPECIES: DUF3305 domain-containing protein [unclassified Bradyrhizobium]|uniref:DUF3305 domain-containing protein n=1 Tax=unclassified Bradyrhizobium TaxID=2631580 RepID=UPI0024793480|nr:MULTISPECIES: DUF3305 domain-containing protein [unclassified Bradyrhizobium]WGR68703.1 DUF3305 domain-containing protein [Bradyrhizobium sp. ISRA426]WGR80758.1 DUF3305 domain-containing protein [Bradyrhizobium sp. ISRA430]WGR83943.1 DUF3305 domain-containing protein [Bradyrhizobium sp. ISRA432]
MSTAALPLLRIPVGVLVERGRAESAWADFIWRSIAVLPDKTDTKPWTILREQDGTTLFYAGNATVDLYVSETARYRDNLASGLPSIWVILSPSEGPWPYAVAAATADPAEGEGFTEAADNLVEAVPMPQTLRETIESFIAEHHVEREFVKRERRRADPEALARRQHEGGHE